MKKISSQLGGIEPPIWQGITITLITYENNKQTPYQPLSCCTAPKRGGYGNEKHKELTFTGCI
jgi:hypothetical protein